MKNAIFPGTFDPFTEGHHNIVLRGAVLFDKIIVAIGYNKNKRQRIFKIETILSKVSALYSDNDKILVEVYDELTAQFAKKHDAKYLLRGLRNTTDFEFENSIAQINKEINPQLETVFLITSPTLAPISSTIIREVYQYKGDISAYLPYKLD